MLAGFVGYQGYLMISGAPNNFIFFLMMIFIIVLFMDLDEKFVKYGESYSDDPFDRLSIKNERLIINKDNILISDIQRLELTALDDAGYLSLPYNQQNGRVPTLYFSKGHFLYVRKFLDKHIPNINYIESIGDNQ